METPESKIARVLGVSEDEAHAFVGRVRSLVGPSPCDAWIACCVEMLPAPWSPAAVARKIVEMGLIARPAAGPAAPPPDQPGAPSGRTRESGRPSRKTRATKGPVTGTSTSRDSRTQGKLSPVAHQAPVPRLSPSAAQLAPSDPVGAPRETLGVSLRGAPLTDEGARRTAEKLGQPDVVGPPGLVSTRSPEARVSWVLGVEVRVARTFIEHVRSLLVTPPSADEVALCLEAHPRLRAPLVLAYQLADEAYAKEHPVERRPPQIEPRNFRSGRKEPRRPRTKWKPWNDPRDAEADPFDPSRVPLRNLGACPHGVPITDVCRICSPAKFEQRSDLD